MWSGGERLEAIFAEDGGEGAFKLAPGLVSVPSESGRQLEKALANQGTCRWVVHLCVGAVQVDLQVEVNAVRLQATEEVVEVVVEVLALLSVLLGPSA